MDYVTLAVRLLVGGVFAVAAFGKVRRRSAFLAFAGWLADLPLVPGRAAVVIAGTAVAVELAIVALLVFPATILAGLLLATATLAVFTAETWLAVRRGVHAPCHCFGASATPLTAATVVRDALLCAVALLGVAGSATAPGAGIAPAGGVLAVAGACVAGALVLFFDDIYTLFATNQN